MQPRPPEPAASRSAELRVNIRRAGRALLVTLIVVLLVTVLMQSGVLPPVPTARVAVLALLAVVVYAGSTGGVRAGLLSAAGSALYYALVVVPAAGDFTGYTREALGQVALVAAAFILVGLVVGYLRQRVEAALDRERAARRETEAALEEAKAAAEWAGFLSHASRLLSASLDYRATLKAVAHLAVPDIADWCTVSILDERTGSLRRLEVAATTPSKEDLAQELRERFPVEPDSDHPIIEVVRTGQPKLFRNVPDEALRQSASNEDHFEILRQLGFTSAMIVPLLARGRTVGVIAFVSSESGRHYGSADLARARELAHRAALAVDNARLYGQAQAANVAKSNFLAVMSHELRTPLNAIIGYTDLMLGGIPEPLPEQFRSAVERILASARQLLELIEEILTFARTEAGEIKVRMQDVDAVELARKTAAIIAPTAMEKGIDFSMHPPAEPIMITTDPGKVRQILASLLSNAVKFTDRGSVELHAHLADGRAVFEVRDTGTGIAPEDMKTIFEPFQQIAEPSTREVGGTGLGLSMAQRLAHLIGGTLEAESEPGKGSTFTLRLPMRPPAEEGERAAA